MNVLWMMELEDRMKLKEKLQEVIEVIDWLADRYNLDRAERYELMCEAIAELIYLGG